VAYAYDVDATDADNDPLTYALGSAPAGMTINAGSGLIAWTPAAAQVGANSVSVRVTDGRGGEAVQTFTVTVAQANRPPVITSTAPTAATTGVAYAYDVDATDPDGDALSYALTNAPTGMTIDASSGLIAWAPNATQLGPNAVAVRVTDGRGGEAMQSFAVTVAQANRPPTITTAAPTSATTGAAYTYDVDATDPDGDTLSYALTTAPTGMTMEASSGLIAWTPTAAQAGSSTLTIVVRDGRGGEASQTASIQTSANQAPRIDSLPPRPVAQETSYVYRPTITDPDGGPAPTLRLLGAPAGARLVSGEITWLAGSPDPIGLTTSNPQCLAPAAGATSSLATRADIVTLIDESGSMEGDQAWMRTVVPRISVGLGRLGIGSADAPNRYSLIGFGRSAGQPVYYRYPDNSLFSDSPWAWHVLTRRLIAFGEWEDAYEGLFELSRTYPFAAGAARNVILVTDDGRDAARPSGTPRSTLTYEQVLASLQSAGIRLNAVLDEVNFRCADGRRSLSIDARGIGYVVGASGGFERCSGVRDLTAWPAMKEQSTLALATGGAAWDLQFVRDGGPNAVAFTDAFAAVKLAEIAQSPVVPQLPDLAIAGLRPTESGSDMVRLQVLVRNRGLAAATGGLAIDVRDGTGSEVLAVQASGDSIAPGQQVEITISSPIALRDRRSLRVSVQSAAASVECDTTNNVVEAPVFAIEATDSGGASAQQWWLLPVTTANRPPVLAPVLAQTVRVGELLNLQLLTRYLCI